MSEKRPRDMTLGELFAIGNRMNESNAASGMPRDARDWILGDWIDGLIQYQGVSPAVGDALRYRWALPIRGNDGLIKVASEDKNGE